MLGIDENGGLRLSDGRIARVAGLDLGAGLLSPADWKGHRENLMERLSGRALVADPAGGPDRWGRVPVFLAEAQTDGKPRPLMESLVEQGLARVLIGDGVDHCLGSAYMAEVSARSGKSGLWRLEGTGLIAGDDLKSLQKMKGRYVVVEGRVLSVGERKTRTFLNFGRRFSRDFAATIRAGLATQLRAAGFPMSSLHLKTVRLRGYIAGVAAPRLDIQSRAQIEVVEEAGR